MPPHSTGAIIWDPHHGHDSHPGADGWVAVPCPACQDSHGQLRLKIFSGHDVWLTWSLTNDDGGSAVSARGGGRLGPHWLTRLEDNTAAQPVAAP
jgi:hypothetical protein